MRYKYNNKIIRSENAAKSYKQKSKHVVDYLRSRPKVAKLLDFGCGKLRYSEELLSVSGSVTFMDSAIQIDRVQMVRGVVSSVRNYIEINYSTSQCVAFEEADTLLSGGVYDLVTCTNVLSAIACSHTMNKALRLIRDSLNASGEAVFVHQYRCSSFTKYELGAPHLYGHVYDVRGGASYYGIMDNETVEKVLIEQGFQVKEKWTRDDVGFVLACLP